MEIFGWIKIVISSLLAGLLIGIIIYYFKQDIIGLIIGIAVTLCGLILGIIWATRVMKKQGTIEFLSQISATPELDNNDKKEE